MGLTPQLKLGVGPEISHSNRHQPPLRSGLADHKLLGQTIWLKCLIFVVVFSVLTTSGAEGQIIQTRRKLVEKSAGFVKFDQYLEPKLANRELRNRESSAASNLRDPKVFEYPVSESSAKLRRPVIKTGSGRSQCEYAKKFLTRVQKLLANRRALGDGGRELKRLEAIWKQRLKNCSLRKFVNAPQVPSASGPRLVERRGESARRDRVGGRARRPHFRNEHRIARRQGEETEHHGAAQAGNRAAPTYSPDSTLGQYLAITGIGGLFTTALILLAALTPSHGHAAEPMSHGRNPHKVQRHPRKQMTQVLHIHHSGEGHKKESHEESDKKKAAVGIGLATEILAINAEAIHLAAHNIEFLFIMTKIARVLAEGPAAGAGGIPIPKLRFSFPVPPVGELLTPSQAVDLLRKLQKNGNLSKILKNIGVGKLHQPLQLLLDTKGLGGIGIGASSAGGIGGVGGIPGIAEGLGGLSGISGLGGGISGLNGLGGNVGSGINSALSGAGGGGNTFLKDILKNHGSVATQALKDLLVSPLKGRIQETFSPDDS